MEMVALAVSFADVLALAVEAWRSSSELSRAASSPENGC